MQKNESLSIKRGKIKKQKWIRPNRSFQNRQLLEARRVFTRRKGWLPREQWLRKKRFLQLIASFKRHLWLLRREKWLRRNKRPFWKRKSFKRIRAEQNIINNFFFVTKKQYAVTNMQVKKWSAKKILYRRYYRSNSVRRDFKVRIVLRHYWKFRYSSYRHHKLQLFLISVKRKARRLFYFFCKFELVLFRYARWWGLIPHFCQEKLARFFVTHGYIYVNFLPELNPLYKICSQDCIFSVAISHVLNSRFFISNYNPSYGKVKHLAGRKEFVRPGRAVFAPVNTSFFRGKSYKKRSLGKSGLKE